MIKVGVKIQGLKTLNAQFEQLQELAKTKPTDAVNQAAMLIHSEARKNIAKNTDGQPQKRYRPERTVNVSDPFDFPNADTGRLSESIQWQPATESTRNPTALVGSNLNYAKWLEFGTRWMAPRPWLGLAYNNTADTIKKVFQAVGKDIAKSIKNNSGGG